MIRMCDNCEYSGDAYHEGECCRPTKECAYKPIITNKMAIDTLKRQQKQAIADLDDDLIKVYDMAVDAIKFKEEMLRRIKILTADMPGFDVQVYKGNLA